MITRASSILILAGVLVMGISQFAAGQDPTPSPTPDPSATPDDAQRVWNNTGTNFNSNASWNGSFPGANDVAAFTTAPVTQPQLTANDTIAGLYFAGTGTSGYDLTRSGTTQTLTLAGTATNTAGNENSNASAAAIGAENTSGTNTIDVPLILAPVSGVTSTFFQAAGGTLTVNGVISGSSATFGLTKNGGGTVILSGANTYTGATTVNAGKLFINGNQTAATGATTVNGSGTVLGGTGTIGGSVSMASSGAILEGGTGSTGQTLTIKGSLTQVTGSIIELALGPALTHSTLALTNAGSSSFYSTQKVSFIDLGATAGTYQDIITGVTSNPGSLSGWTITNTEFQGSFSWDSSDNGIDLTLTQVPEPGTWCAAALAFGAVLLSQKRRLSRVLARA
jgi:autotransporter-associated beta strand protein